MQITKRCPSVALCISRHCFQVECAPCAIGQAARQQFWTRAEGRWTLKLDRKAAGRDVLEGGGHLPFQVLDASAIEGFRGLVGESASIYSRIQIYKALTPPAPPSGSRRDGRTWASVLCGIL